MDEVAVAGAMATSVNDMVVDGEVAGLAKWSDVAKTLEP